MFFLFRSLFWLSIVFSSMPWTVAGTAPAHPVGAVLIQSGLALAGAAKDVAGQEARAWCVKDPRQCLADAAQLTALVTAYQAEGTADDPSRPASPTIPPLPRARGLHHVAPKS